APKKKCFMQQSSTPPLHTDTTRRPNCASRSNRCSRTSLISPQLQRSNYFRLLAVPLLIRRICNCASVSSSASNCLEMFESLLDHDAPTTTGGNSGNSKTRTSSGGLKPGTATAKPIPYPLAT